MLCLHFAVLPPSGLKKKNPVYSGLICYSHFHEQVAHVFCSSVMFSLKESTSCSQQDQNTICMYEKIMTKIIYKMTDCIYRHVRILYKKKSKKIKIVTQ